MNSHSLHFYFQVKSVGQLWSSARFLAHASFHVNPRWIPNLVESGKVHLEDAKEEFVRTCVDVGRHIDNLDTIGRVRQEQRLDKGYGAHAVRAFEAALTDA